MQLGRVAGPKPIAISQSVSERADHNAAPTRAGSTQRNASSPPGTVIETVRLPSVGTGACDRDATLGAAAWPPSRLAMRGPANDAMIRAVGEGDAERRLLSAPESEALERPDGAAERPRIDRTRSTADGPIAMARRDRP